MIRMGLENEIKAIVDKWILQRNEDPRGFGPSGVVALQISERFTLFLLSKRRESFVQGAKQALQLLAEIEDYDAESFSAKIEHLSREMVK